MYQGNYETVLACTKSIPSDSSEEYIKEHYINKLYKFNGCKITKYQSTYNF